MTHGDNDTQKKDPAVAPISGPAGLDLSPKPESPRRVSRRAAALIGGIVFVLLERFFFGAWLNLPAGAAITLALRMAGIRWRLALPIFEDPRQE